MSKSSSYISVAHPKQEAVPAATSNPALLDILEKSVRELGAIRLNDSLTRVFMLPLSSPARSIAMGSLFEVGVGSCPRVPFLLVSAQRSSATAMSAARFG